MCTVTYYPLQTGFILTHNRDEAPARSPHALTKAARGERMLLFPRDTGAQGSWIVAAEGGQTACLLNGAFERHERRLPYRRSRGLVLLDSFDYENAEDFVGQYDFSDIEPFTYLHMGANSLLALRWDGKERHIERLDPKSAHFWCSSTLYPAPMRQKREAVFRAWLQSGAPVSADALLDIHQKGSVGDPENDFVMNRGDRVRTVSITQVVREAAALRMRYEDLLENGVLLEETLF